MKLIINFDSTFSASLDRIISNDPDIDEISIQANPTYYDYPSYAEDQEAIRREGLRIQISNALKKNTHIHTVIFNGDLIYWKTMTDFFATFNENPHVKKISLYLSEPTSTELVKAMTINKTITEITVQGYISLDCKKDLIKMMQVNRNIISLETPFIITELKPLLDYNRYERYLSSVTASNNGFGMFANQKVQHEDIEKAIYHLETELKYIHCSVDKLLNLSALKYLFDLINSQLYTHKEVLNEAMKRFPEAFTGSSNDLACRLLRKIKENNGELSFGKKTEYKIN